MPGAGLELVVYTAIAAAARMTGATFELNLNSGATMPFRADVEPVAGELHWFAIDRSILRDRGLVACRAAREGRVRLGARAGAPARSRRRTALVPARWPA